MSADPKKLPAARLVPKDRADQMAILRSQASEGARKAGRTAVTLGKGLAVLALCGAGLAVVGGIGGSRRSSRALDDLDRSMQTLRRLDLQPRFDTLHYDQIQAQAYRDLMQPRVWSFSSQRYPFQQLELMGEPLHQSR